MLCILGKGKYAGFNQMREVLNSIPMKKRLLFKHFLEQSYEKPDTKVLQG